MKRFSFRIFAVAPLFCTNSAITLADVPFSGKWAVGQEACKLNDSYTIGNNGFKDDLTGDDSCVFSSVKQLGEGVWAVNAKCGASGKQIAFKFKLAGNSLSVAGGHNVRKWVRCR